MPIRGKVISEISPEDILDLILQGTPEDAFLEFKAELMDPRKPREQLQANRADWVADVVAFANAEGGHIIVGMEADDQERASQLKPMTGDWAKGLADSLRDHAIQYIKPRIERLEVRGFEIPVAGWIVIAGIPYSEAKPYMSSFGNATKFTIRDGNRKREMAYEEIRALFLKGPEQQIRAQFLDEVLSINSRIGSIEKEIERLGNSWNTISQRF